MNWKTRLILASLVISLGAWSVHADTTAAKIKQVYTKQCSKCHGKDGKGKTRMGRMLGAKDYTSPKVQEALKEADMFKAIKEGIKAGGRRKMLPAKHVTDDEIKELIKYIRHFKKSK